MQRFMVGLFLLALPLQGCFEVLANSAAHTTGSYGTAKGLNVLFDRFAPMSEEQDRRVLSGEYAENLRLQNELLKQELEERRGQTSGSASQSNRRRNSDGSGYVYSLD